MDLNRVKNQLRSKLTDYVQNITRKDRKTGMYICPLCGSGTRKNHSGAFSIKDGIKWKCFSCNESGDIFDLIGSYEKVQGYTEQFKRAIEIYEAEIVYCLENQQFANLEYKSRKESKCNTVAEDFNSFFLQAHKDVEQTDYWKRRGLSKVIVDRFNLGYVAKWRHPKVPNAIVSPRLIIPISKYSYIARDIRDKIPEKQEIYKKIKVKGLSKVNWIFNKEALVNSKKPIIVVEGEIDALSVMEVGGEAVALGSTSNVKSFIEILKTEKLEEPLVISLDNDKAGRKASKELRSALKALKIPFYEVNISGEYKDPNDALRGNKEAFRSAVEYAQSIPREIERGKKDIYLQSSSINYIRKFMDGISNSVSTSFVPTGFEKLDRALDGGIYDGLYIIGAISSLGKTTMVLQIADQIASLGQDVLMFSLEMARSELISKSISRHTLQRVMMSSGNMIYAKTSREITTSSRYSNYSLDEKKLINESVLDYGKYAKHVFINEGAGDMGVRQIRNVVKQHTYFTGNVPIVIVDYLQILAPYSERATDKQNMDKAVKELKQLSRDFKTPVIGISSFNRENYKNSVTMEAFKESGAIEYSSDVLLGLQFKGTGGKDFKVDEAKQKNPREVELVILKNRNGSIGNKILFNFYPHFNYFEEI